MKRWQMEWLLVSVALVWGANYTIGKYGVAYMSSIQFNSLRFLVASPVLLLITFMMERSLRIEKRLVTISSSRYRWYGNVSNDVYAICEIYFSNERLIINCDVTYFTGDISSIAQTRTFFDESTNWFNSSVYWCSIRFINRTYRRNYLRICVARKHNWISRSDCVGMVSILAQPLITKYSAMRVTSWSTLIGIVPLVVYCLFNVNTLTWPVDMPSWGSLAYSIVFATIFGLAMWYVGISQIGSTKVMVYMYLVPLFAVILRQ